VDTRVTHQQFHTDSPGIVPAKPIHMETNQTDETFEAHSRLATLRGILVNDLRKLVLANPDAYPLDIHVLLAAERTATQAFQAAFSKSHGGE
jgi:hypothetical protein